MDSGPAFGCMCVLNVKANILAEQRALKCISGGIFYIYLFNIILGCNFLSPKLSG